MGEYFLHARAVTRALASTQRALAPRSDAPVRKIGKQFEIEVRNERTLRISRETLPSAPTVIILDGV